MKLTIFYFSDTHGSVLNNNCLFRFKDIIKKDDHTLVIDGGDTLQGATFLNFLKEKNNIKYLGDFFNEIGLDYFIPGNHDFNFGVEYLKGFINILKGKTLCANISGISKILPYDIIEMDNKKIGIIGITNDFFLKYENFENLKNILVEDEYEVIKRHYSYLQSTCDYLIGVYHGGLEKDHVTNVSEEMFDQNKTYKILEEFEFDLFLTAHQHQFIKDKTINKTKVFQPRAMAEGVFKITIDLNTKGIESEFISPKGYNGDLDDTIKDFFSWMDTPLTQVNAVSYQDTHLDIALNNHAIPNMVNQILKKETGADISMVSFGNNPPQLPTDVVRIRDVFNISPFPNSFSKVSISGLELKRILDENSKYFTKDGGMVKVHKNYLKPKPRHHHLDFFYGVTFDITTKGRSTKISNVKVNGEGVKPLKQYTICVSNFRLAGAHGYHLFKRYDMIEKYSFNIQDLLIDELKKHKEFRIDTKKYFTIF